MLRHINFRPASHLEFISARFRFDDIVNLLLQREGRWLSSATMYVCHLPLNFAFPASMFYF